MLRSPLSWYGALWFMIKFSTMGKSWDFVTVSLVAAGMLAAIIGVTKYAIANRENPATMLTIMGVGLAYYIAGEFFPQLDWILDTGSHELDMVICWGSGIFAFYWVFKILRLVLIDYGVIKEEQEEQEEDEEEEEIYEQPVRVRWWQDNYKD